MVFIHNRQLLVIIVYREVDCRRIKGTSFAFSECSHSKYLVDIVFLSLDDVVGLHFTIPYMIFSNATKIPLEELLL